MLNALKKSATGRLQGIPKRDNEETMKLQKNGTRDIARNSNRGHRKVNRRSDKNKKQRRDTGVFRARQNKPPVAKWLPGGGEWLLISLGEDDCKEDAAPTTSL